VKKLIVLPLTNKAFVEVIINQSVRPSVRPNVL